MNRWITFIGFLALLHTATSAEPLTLPKIFRDHMVLQRDKPVAIWGQANPGDEIAVAFAGQSKKVNADGDGKWMMKLDPMPASSEPRELRVQSGGTGRAITLKDVLVGEVWLCSGQSNMRYVMGKRANMPGVEQGDEEIGKPERPHLRIFTDDGEEVWENRGWQRCGGESLARFSATAFFFGDSLQRELQVPVGVINISRGGTSIQAWTRREFALRNPFTRHYAELQEKSRDAIAAFNAAQREARLARRAGRKDPPEVKPLDREIEIARVFHVANLYDSLVEPLAPFTIRGVIWYQGESNGSRIETAREYGSMLRDLIEGWRDRWSDPEMPWHIMQLPCWGGATSAPWPHVRQGQWEAAHTISNVGLAVISDVADPSNLHPPQKREAGDRLARLALARNYGKQIQSTGPTPKLAQRRADAVVVEFEANGSAIALRGDKWNDVEVAGADGIYHPATALFAGNTATVQSDRVAEPKGIRYGWSPVFIPSLFNAADLPAAPFALRVSDDGKIRPGLVEGASGGAHSEGGTRAGQRTQKNERVEN